jgi:hypothetical protein
MRFLLYGQGISQRTERVKRRRTQSPLNPSFGQCITLSRCGSCTAPSIKRYGFYLAATQAGFSAKALAWSLWITENCSGHCLRNRRDRNQQGPLGPPAVALATSTTPALPWRTLDRQAALPWATLVNWLTGCSSIVATVGKAGIDLQLRNDRRMLFLLPELCRASHQLL